MARWRPPSPGKYKNTWTKRDGLMFQSQMEADRWSALKLLERAGLISNLKRQVTFQLADGKYLIATYRADFVYEENGETVVEDSKGVVTADFRMKYYLMRSRLGIAVRLTGKSGKPKALPYRYVKNA